MTLLLFFCFVKLKHAEFRLFKRSTDTSQNNFTLHYPISHGRLKIPLHVYLVVPDLITKVVEVPLDLAHHWLSSTRMRYEYVEIISIAQQLAALFGDVEALDGLGSRGAVFVPALGYHVLQLIGHQLVNEIYIRALACFDLLNQFILCFAFRKRARAIFIQ